MSVEIMYQVNLAEEALFVYLHVKPASEVDSLDRALSLLETFPRLGHRYDPVYEAARLPFSLYILNAGKYGIYYEVDDTAKTVTILFIEDERRNPLDRFSETHRFYGE